MSHPSLDEHVVVHELLPRVAEIAFVRLRRYARSFYPADPENLIADAIAAVVAHPAAYLRAGHPLTHQALLGYLSAIVRRLGLAASRRETVRGRVLRANVERWRRHAASAYEVAVAREQAHYPAEFFVGTG